MLSSYILYTHLELLHSYKQPIVSMTTDTYNGLSAHVDGPEISEEEDPSFVAAENDNVTLICGTMLVGSPAPVIEWTNNEGNVINTTSNDYIFNNGPDVVSLVIIGTQLVDSGNWTCRLTTSETGGEVQRILTLTVIGA